MEQIGTLIQASRKPTTTPSTPCKNAWSNAVAAFKTSYPSPSDVQRAYNPVHWGYTANNPQKAYQAACPTLIEYDSAYGHGEAANWIDIQVSALFGASSKADKTLADSIGIFANTFAAEAKTRGMDVVYEGTFDSSSQTDFNVQLTGAQSAGADLLFLPIYYTPASVILTQANAMGYAPTFFGVDGMDGILTADGFDASLAEGVYLLTPFSADAQDEATQNFVNEYKERHNGETPNQFAADAYDAVYILYEAIKASGVTPDMSNEEICDGLIQAMGDLSVVGLTSAGSEMTWDDNGAVSKDPAAVIIKDGTYVTP